MIVSAAEGQTEFQQQSKQNRLCSLPFIRNTSTYWLVSIHSSCSYETINTTAKRKKLPDQRAFGGKAMSLELSNINKEVKATKVINLQSGHCPLSNDVILRASSRLDFLC